MSDKEVKSWRVDRTPLLRPSDKERVGWVDEDLEPIRFFDQLYFIGSSTVGCFVLKTSEGLVMFESMEPTRRAMKLLLEGFEKLGLSFDDLKAVYICHAHYDHFGGAGIIKRMCNAKVYMSKDDHEDGIKFDPHIPEKVLMWDPDGYVGLEDIVMGDTVIHCFKDYDNVHSGVSYVFEVTDNGEKHMAGLWGGTESYIYEPYAKSLEKFREFANGYGCDVALYMHGLFDNTRERLEICRNLANGGAHPFVVGNDGFNRYLDMHRDDAYRGSLRPRHH